MAKFELPRPIKYNNEFYKVVALREMRGSEEDILVSRRTKLDVYDRFLKVVESCTESIDAITDRNQIHDIMQYLCVSNLWYLIVMLRAISVDEKYRFNVICEICGNKLDLIVNLFDLEVRKSEITDDKITVDVNGNKFTLVPLLVNNKLALQGLLQRGDEASYDILARVEAINDKIQVGLQDIKNLSIKDRNELRTYIEKLEGGVNNEVDVTCRHCGAEFVALLNMGEIGSAFFRGR